MWYVVASLLGMAGGALCVFLAVEIKRRRIEEQRRQNEAKEEYLRKKTREVEEMHKVLKDRVISYDEVQDENKILKQDLHNIDVNLRKSQLDYRQQQEMQEAVDLKVRELGGRYLKENVKWVSSSLTPNNFTRCTQRIQKVIESCRGIGFEISPKEEAALLADLQKEFARVVRAADEREEQARIKAQIREEQRREREIEREQKQLEREREVIQAALQKAIAETKDEHNAEVERLKAKLVEAEEKSQRAMSRAQMTKSGHVYVVSNVGSFGDGIYKIGMTRRFEPMDRVKELGDASVPFPFDVHMMISSDDAPSLENALHRAFHKLRVNKINPRKEFFRTQIDDINRIVTENHGEVQYVADAEALEYRQSLEMTDDDQEFIESVYDKFEDDGLEPDEDDQ
ncbi:MAG: GIY-YIG nuclease family protein [Phycisphaerales bacterium]|nr:GIY-YIG nuclease family protein [Phycisphaerales bacterium]